LIFLLKAVCDFSKFLTTDHFHLFLQELVHLSLIKFYLFYERLTIHFFQFCYKLQNSLFVKGFCSFLRCYLLIEIHQSSLAIATIKQYAFGMQIGQSLYKLFACVSFACLLFPSSISNWWFFEHACYLFHLRDTDSFNYEF